MSYNDLIRRGDALAAAKGFIGAETALAAVPAADPLADPRVQALVVAIERLNAACDAMWNDHERLEENPGRFGQKYRLKELHMRAISEAQQALPDLLAAFKGKQ